MQLYATRLSINAFETDDTDTTLFDVTIPPSDVAKIRVLLQFSKKQYPYIVSKPLHHSQEIVDAENRILAIEVCPTYEFTQLILSFGFDVKVLEPEPFKQEILAIYTP